MKLFVDDIRPAPEGWLLAKSISEAVSYLNRYGIPGAFGYSDKHITHVSLDHDISIETIVDGKVVPHPSPDTFQVVAHYMVEKMCGTNPSLDPDLVITTHSANPQGRKSITGIFDDCGFTCTEAPLPQATRRI